MPEIMLVLIGEKKLTVEIHRFALRSRETGIRPSYISANTRCNGLAAKAKFETLNRRLCYALKRVSAERSWYVNPSRYHDININLRFFTYNKRKRMMSSYHVGLPSFKMSHAELKTNLLD